MKEFIEKLIINSEIKVEIQDETLSLITTQHDDINKEQTEDSE